MKVTNLWNKLRILSGNNRNFVRELDKLLSIRKKKVQSSSVSVTNIINDVKKTEIKLY